MDEGEPCNTLLLCVHRYALDCIVRLEHNNRSHTLQNFKHRLELSTICYHDTILLTVVEQ